MKRTRFTTTIPVTFSNLLYRQIEEITDRKKISIEEWITFLIENEFYKLQVMMEDFERQLNITPD
jgi:hypothetical protein